MGISVSQIRGVKECYSELESIISLTMSVFFVSVGFLVPVTLLFRWDTIVLGVIFTIPAVLTKLAVGGFESTWNKRLILGWSMVGRGEVGFMMASSAYAGGVLPEKIFLIVMWALILATSLSPFPFQYFVKKLHNS